MLSTLKYYASWFIAGLFGYVIPFWVWALVGLAAAIAVFVFLPVLVPERIRMAICGLVFTLGAILSAGSWGIDHGISIERVKWERIVANEKLRLKLEAESNLQREQQRADSAELQSKILRGQLDAILSDTAPISQPASVDCPPAVAEPTARRLRDLKPRRH